MSGIQMTMHGIPEATPEANSDWYCTPPEILDVVRTFWPEGIDLDPCSNQHSLVVSDDAIMLPADGLVWRKWEGYVYVNPPYSDPGPWLQKCARSGAECLALVKADTSTQWWEHEVWGQADAVCFWHGRIRFYLNGERQGSSNFPSALVYYGKKAEAFCDVFEDYGWCTTL